MANEADLKLIEIGEFEQTSAVAGTGEEYIVVRKADGKTYKMSTADFKAFLGTVQVQVPKALAPTDPAPTLSGVYYPTVTQNEAGTPIVYANAGGISVNTAEGGADHNSMVQLIYDGSLWVKVNVPIEVPEPDLSGVPTIQSVGIKKINAGQNVFSELVGSDLNNTSLWGVGFLNSVGAVVSTSTGWRYTIKFYDLFEGSYPNGFIAITGNTRLIVYDADKKVIQNISNTSPYTITVNAIAGARYVRTSWGTSAEVGAIASDTSKIKLSPSSSIIEATNEVFAMPADVSKAKNEAVSEAIDEAKVLVDGTVEKLGFEVLPIGTNLISELSSSDPLDREIWGTGFLNENGTIGSPTTTNWIYSKPYEPIVPGLFSVELIINGNAKALIYNKDKEVIQVITNSNPNYNYKADVTAIEGATYFRTSHSNLVMPSVTDIKFTNKSIIYRGKTQDTSGVVIEGDSAPVNSIGVIGLYKNIIKASNPPLPKMPIVSFISDDGRVENDDWYIQVLEEREVKSTFAIVTSWLSPSVTNAWNKERVMELHRQGHDIAGHTHTHPMTADLSDIQKEYELQECKKRLLELGINPTMFIAPFGSVNLATDKVIRKYFDTDFVTGARADVAAGTCCNSAPLRRIRLTRVSFDMGQNGVSNLQHCKDAVDVAFAKNEWLIFAIHPQYPEYYPGNGNTFFQERRDELGLLIDYIRSKQIAIMTARDGYEIWKNPVQIGDYGIDTKFYELGMDGSERGNFFE